jgi:hypothetical protein
MPRFYITSENTEDTFDQSDNLDDAIRIARDVAQKSQAGDPVCIQLNGKNIWEFVLMANGTVAQKKIA